MANRARARSTWAAGALSERLRRVSSWRSSAVSGRRGSFWWHDMGHLGARGSPHHYTSSHGRRPTSMIAHAGGPPFQTYVMPQRLARDVFVGTGAVLFAAINWIKLPPYVALGQFTRENLLTSAALFPLAVLATWLGVLLVRQVSGERFYTAIYILLILVGLKLVWQGARGVL